MNVLSLFDGMSCGQIALDQLGIEVDNYYASEIDKWAIKVAKKNYPNMIHIGDVTEVKSGDVPKIDLLLGGSPCQGFSFAGDQLAFDDPRSALFFEYVRLLKELKPKYFLLENVRMKKEFQDIISEFLGVEPIMINSSLLSAQNRVRLYWTNIPNIRQPEDRGILLKDVLVPGLDGDRECQVRTEVQEFSADTECHHVATASDINGHDCIKRIYADGGKAPTLNACTGGNREPKVLVGRIVGRKINPKTGRRDDYNPDLKAVQRLEPRLDEKSGCLTTVQKDNVVVLKVPEATKKGYIEVKDGDCFDWTHPNSKTRRGRQMKDKSNCLTVSGYDFRQYVHPSYRKLTPLECERLQTVPDEYTDGVSNSQRYKMLGNGWTVSVIKHILGEMKW